MGCNAANDISDIMLKSYLRKYFAYISRIKINSSMKKKSWVWQHITTVFDLNEEAIGYQCNICKATFSKDTDVSSFVYHLSNVDKISKNEEVKEEVKEARQASIEKFSIVALSKKEKELVNRNLAKSIAAKSLPLSLV